MTDSPAITEAQENFEHLQLTIKTNAKSTVEIARLLYIAKYRKLYRGLGHRTLAEYGKTLGISEGRIAYYIKIYEFAFLMSTTYDLSVEELFNSQLIYLVNNVDSFKIGLSSIFSLNRRMVSLQIGNAYPLSFCGAVISEDAAVLEKTLHEIYKHTRMQGEWFSHSSFNEVREIFRWSDKFISPLGLETFLPKGMR